MNFTGIWTNDRPRIIEHEGKYIVKLGCQYENKYLDISWSNVPYYWMSLNKHVTRFESVEAAKKAFNKVRGIKKERFVDYL